jgi:thiosulfate reductase cytochrome b subunit
VFGTRRFSRELLPHREQWRQIGATFRDQLRLRFHGADRARYNVLQQLTYLAVILILAPLAVLTGLTMSPAVDAAAPWLLDMFGGRQSARTIHFVVTGLFVLFGLLHVTMVVVSGFLNNMRSMITGWYDVTRHRAR